MVPVAATGSSREIAQTASLRFHQLLVSLEGNQRTGCLRIVSPRSKSRSAILIYRGRVLGCLYGNKKLEYQCIQEDAHKQALADLASPGNILDAYELSEELVLAAASLFNGEVLDTNFGTEPISCFEQTLRTLSSTSLPGCILISTVDEEMLCMIYLYDGKIIGVFSAKEGWLSASVESVQKHLTPGRLLRISASYLPVSDRKQATNLGFSLTGLTEQPVKKPVTQQIQAIDSFSTMRVQPSTYSNQTPVIALPAVVPKRRTTSGPVRSDNVFAIAPFA